MARIHGKNGTVYLQGAGAAAILLSQATDWEIDIDYDTADVPVLGDLWNSKVKGIAKFSGSLSGSYDTGQTLAFDAATQATSRSFYIYPDRSQATRYYYGFCWPKLNVKGGVGDAVTFDASFDGDGQLAAN
jgi:hypothetical protein